MDENSTGFKLLQKIGILGMSLGKKKKKTTFKFNHSKAIAIEVLSFLEENPNNITELKNQIKTLTI
jgi:hypothetical protein